ncbi:hypothetical protein V1511DRAFT_508066 [Dipodascopsis uninucleata]
MQACFKLIFLDFDAVLVRAWSRLLVDAIPASIMDGSFRPEVLCEPLADLQSTVHFDCVVSPANSFGSLDGGFDLVILQMFANGTSLKDTQAYVRNVHRRRWRGYQPIGSSYLIDMQPFMDAGAGSNKFRCRYIAHTPTMQVPAAIERPEVIYDCMWSLLNEIHNHNDRCKERTDFSMSPIRSVLLTGLGTGTGHVNETLCAKLMISAYADFLHSLDRTNDSDSWSWTVGREWREKIRNLAQDNPQQ